MLMNTQTVSNQERELPWPALKINSLKSKQFSSLGCGRGRGGKKDVKMKVYPSMSMETKDGENFRQVYPRMLLKIL
jgi:hypothetical protein